MTPQSPNPRRHDLDALRASAMLLGIVFHVSLSMAPGFPWMVQDARQADGLYLFQAWVHGFRMPLFMLASGFFTAMLWRQKGLKALLWHRCRRVLFPLLLSMVTILPAMLWASGFAAASEARRPPPTQPASASLWAAVQLGDRAALEKHLASGASVTALHPLYGTTPLTWAALNGQREIAGFLIDRGAPVSGLDREGNTALHAAAFMGEAGVADLLIARGADINAASHSGETPLASAAQDFATVQYISGLLRIPLAKERWEQGRQETLDRLRALGAESELKGGSGQTSARRIVNTLVETPIFAHLWFLWFLVWLIALFALCAPLAARLGWRPGPRPWILSPARLLWLAPITLLPASLMEFNFGPDTSMGLLPMPRVLAYFAIFFFFGALYFEAHDRAGALGRSWRWSLPAAILLAFPPAFEFATGFLGLRDRLLPAPLHRPVSILLQTVFAWMMCFGCIGMFRELLARETKAVRYLSDASYWLYLTHLPLVIAAQTLIKDWPGSPYLKLLLLSAVIIAFLLGVYQIAVRYTWLGALLNGRKTRPAKTPPVVQSPAGSAS